MEIRALIRDEYSQDFFYSPYLSSLLKIVISKIKTDTMFEFNSKQYKISQIEDTKDNIKRVFIEENGYTTSFRILKY